MSMRPEPYSMSAYEGSKQQEEDEERNRLPVRAPPSFVHLKRRSLTEWLLQNCVDGESVKVIMLKNGQVALQNERTSACYFLPSEK